MGFVHLSSASSNERGVDPFDEERALRYDDWFDRPAGSLARQLQHRLLRSLVDPQPAESALDVGCGTGETLRFLDSLQVRAAGVDRSPAMLAVAAMKNSGVPLVLGDATALPFADRSFDIVVLNTTLEFVSDPGRAVAEAARVARRCIYVGVLNRWSVLGLHRRIESRLTDTLYAHATFFTFAEIMSFLDVCGVFNIRWAGVPFVPDPLSRWSLLRQAARAAGKLPNPFAAYLGCAADVAAMQLVRVAGSAHAATIPQRTAVAGCSFSRRKCAA